MALDTTSFAYALRHRYEPKVKKIVYKDNPLLAMVPKDENFRGRNRHVAVIHATGPGRSATFSTAQSNATNHKGKAFVVTHAKDYAVAKIDGMTVRISKGDGNALLEAAEVEIDMALHAAKRSLAIGLYRNGSGSIGKRGSVSGSTLTLSDAETIVNFYEGMKLQACATETGSSVRSGTITVTAVDRDAGTFDFSGTITGFADADFLYQEGDYDGKISGLDAWIPSSAPTSTLFFSVDRTADKTRLGGVRFDGSGMAIEEALVKGAARIAREGGAPSHCFLSFTQWGNLESLLGSKKQYIDEEIAGVGFTGLRVQGPKGTIKVFADVNCPNDVAWMLQLDSWELLSAGAAPGFLDEDGLQMLREASSDGYEVRVGYYGNLACKAPGWNGRIKLATT